MKRFSLSLVFILLAPSWLVAEESDVSFSRDVLPILSNKCFICHGPDSQQRSELRLDTPELASSDRGGYRAIDPTSPEESEVLVRIGSADDPMPPADIEKPLTDIERDLIKRWVNQYVVPAGTEAKKSKKTVAGLTVHRVDVSGAYVRPPFSGGGQFKGYRLLAVVIESKELGLHYVKLNGPQETVGDSEEAFDKMIDGLRQP